MEVARCFGKTFPCSVAVPTGWPCHKAGGIFTAPGLTAQPFFETALAGTGYCNTYSNCTSAVVDKEEGNLSSQSVWSMWSDLDAGGFNFPRTMLNNPIAGSPLGPQAQMTSGIAASSAVGYSNCNAYSTTV